MENETNIISDEDFLKEIFNGAPIEDNKDTTKDFIETLLDDADADENEKEKPVAETLDTEEVSETSEEDIQTEEKTSVKRFGVKDSITSLIENGVWDDMPVKYGDKEYDNIIDLLDKEKPSKELFDLLSIAQKKHREDLIDSNYVKIGDKDSTKAKLVNAILNDIDYTDLLDYNKEVIQPLQRIDFASIENGDRIAEEFVKQCLVDIDGYHPASIQAAVESLKKDFKIIEKAEEYQKITIEKFNSEIERRKSENDELIKQENDAIKQSIKDTRQHLKSKEYTDSFSNKMIKLRFSKDYDGKFHYEKLIEDKIKDKDFEAKLMHLLLDEEDFISKVTSKVKTQTSKKYLELVNASPKETGGKASQSGDNLHTGDEDLFRELGLLKD